jgi:2-(1,2-epoxy-1,2-dihydrophenyl)acetyl-CoA isomerase
MSLQYETLLRTDEDSVSWITLNRPAQQNAFGETMREELLQALLSLQEDDAIRVIVITGAGRQFCSGGDLRETLALKEAGAGFEKLLPLLDEGRRLVTLLHEMPKPVLAMVNGPASGAGMNLALACDLRIASDHANFAQNHVHAGMHPDWGGTFFLPRLVGAGRALELMWTGRRLEAEEAEEIGLVQQVVPHAHLREHTARIARRLAKTPASVLRLMKMAVLNSHQFDLNAMLDFEAEAQAQVWQSEETGARLSSFAERKSMRAR